MATHPTMKTMHLEISHKSPDRLLDAVVIGPGQASLATTLVRAIHANRWGILIASYQIVT